jgi:hypothetical protein
VEAQATGTETNGRAKRATLFLHKSTGFFFKAGRKEKDEEDGVESGRNLPTWKTAIEEIFCSTIYCPQITKERKRHCFT